MPGLSLHQPLRLRGDLRQQGGVGAVQLLRQHGQELPVGHGLHILVGAPDGGVAVLDGGGPEVAYFLEVFMDSFSLSLDQSQVCAVCFEDASLFNMFSQLPWGTR